MSDCLAGWPHATRPNALRCREPASRHFGKGGFPLDKDRAASGGEGGRTRGATAAERVQDKGAGGREEANELRE
jgi:hypothetical protein